MNEAQLYNKKLLQAERNAEKLTTLRHSSKEKVEKLEQLESSLQDRVNAIIEKQALIEYLNTNMKKYDDKNIFLFSSSKFTVLIGDSQLSKFLNSNETNLRIFKINKNWFCINFAIFVFKIYLLVKNNMCNMIDVKRVMNIMKDTVEMNEKKTKDETQKFPWKSFFTSVWLSPENLYLIIKQF